jgi:anti-sigma B factor antagonist
MTRDRLDLTVKRMGATVVIEVGGALDAATAPLLMERVRILCGHGARRLRIDLDGVRFIDSRGLAALIHCRRRAHHSGAELEIVAGDGAAKRLLDVTGLAGVFAAERD